MAEETQTAAEAAAEDAARVGDDAVERRAVSVGTIKRSRRLQPPEGVEFAATRGTYRDADGRRRNVGAGQPVPDGWERIESADLAERSALTNLEDNEQGGGAGEPDADSSSGSSSRSRSRSRAK